MRAAGKSCLWGMRSHARALLAATLPALLLRALIPYGFMPVAGSGGAALQLCPGAASVAGAPLGHPHHHHHEGSGSADGSAHALCVFAASAAPAVAPVAPAMPLHSASLTHLEQQGTRSLRLPSILRTQSARAPPSRA